MNENEIRIDDSPYQRFLGIEMVRSEDGLVEIRLPFRDEFLREDGSDWLHGGVVSALVDIAGDYAVTTKASGNVPTIDLRVDYLRPARRGDLVAIGRTVRNPEKNVVTRNATFMIHMFFRRLGHFRLSPRALPCRTVSRRLR